MIMPRFVPLVVNGTKRTTVRLMRKRMPKAGHRIELRVWQGRPYNSPQRIVLWSEIKSVRRFAINAQGSFYIDGAKVGQGRRDAVAIADGFADASEMVAFFTETHALPFRGFITEWL